MPIVDFGDYTVETTVTPRGKTETVVWKPGTEVANRELIETRAQAALAANAAFLALGAPTNPQTLAQVQLLTRECSGIIRLLLRQLDSVAGT